MLSSKLFVSLLPPLQAQAVHRLCSMKRMCVLLLWLSLVTLVCAQIVHVDGGSFSSSYDLGTLCPRQVEWSVCPDDLGDVKRNPSWRFLPDVPLLEVKANHDDYTNSGYDRGHMCPAADRSSSMTQMRSTFVMSNVAPQKPSLNRGAWFTAENVCRKAALLYGSVNVLSMPVFLHRDTTYIGRHRIAVPHAFIKVAWVPPNDSVIGIWFMWNSE